MMINKLVSLDCCVVSTGYVVVCWLCAKRSCGVMFSSGHVTLCAAIYVGYYCCVLQVMWCCVCYTQGQSASFPASGSSPRYTVSSRWTSAE